MTLVDWQYCNDTNDINRAIKNKDEDWEGLTSADDIISITYDTNHGCYVVFWKMESEDLGDYPDTIPNQFDNMTGGMNL